MRAVLLLAAALALCACALPSELRGATESDDADARSVSHYELCYSDEDEAICEELPASLIAAGDQSVALRESPRAAAGVITEVAPGETVSAIGYTTIRYYAHRGVVRRAGGQLSAGEVVYPLVWYEADSYPFREWEDPADESYSVEADGVSVEVLFRNANAPSIDWRRVRPRDYIEEWAHLRRTDGSEGWALVRHCAFRSVSIGECVGTFVADGVSQPLVPNTAHPRLVHTLRSDVIIGARFTVDGSRIVTSSSAPPLESSPVVERTWDATSGALIGVVAPDATRSVTIADGVAQIRTAEGRVVASVRDDESRINGAVLAANGAHLATLSDNYTAILWDAATGALLFRFAGRFDRLSGLGYSPDGDIIVTWGGSWPLWEAEEPTRFWDARTGRLIRIMDFSGPVDAFSPDGSQYARIAWDTVTVYDTASGRVIRTVGSDSRHEPFHSVEFSPDGTRILTGDPWSTARVWDIASGEVVLTLEPFAWSTPGVRQGPGSSVTDARFSPDGTRILTVGRGVAQVWAVNGD